MRQTDDRVDVNDELRETIAQGTAAFPLMIYTNDFSRFLNHQIGWHWHDELEFSLVVSGRVRVCANDYQFTLQEGQGIFINTNTLHFMAPADEQNAILETIVFSPRLFKGDPSTNIYEKYIEPILKCPNFSALLLSPFVPWQKEMLTLLQKVLQLDGRALGHELRVRILISDIWCTMIENVLPTLDSAPPQPHASHVLESRARTMLSYIHEHYMEEITVSDIAQSASISRAECFRTFNAVFNQKPIACLIDYRLTMSQKLLRDSGMQITDIALQCGFNHTSYFCRVFRDKCGISPKEYRARSNAAPANARAIDTAI